MATDEISKALLSPDEFPSKILEEPEPASTSKGSAHRSNGSASLNVNGIVENYINGTIGDDDDLSPEERIAELETELERTREERENFAAQYRTLLSRIQTMKNTLGNKLKEDAVSVFTYL